MPDRPDTTPERLQTIRETLEHHRYTNGAVGWAKDLLAEVDRLTAQRAETWEDGARTAWARSTPEVNGQTHQWRSSGHPLNPHQKENTP